MVPTPIVVMGMIAHAQLKPHFSNNIVKVEMSWIVPQIVFLNSCDLQPPKKDTWVLSLTINKYGI